MGFREYSIGTGVFFWGELVCYLHRSRLRTKNETGRHEATMRREMIVNVQYTGTWLSNNVPIICARKLMNICVTASPSNIDIVFWVWSSMEYETAPNSGKIES